VRLALSVDPVQIPKRNSSKSGNCWFEIGKLLVAARATESGEGLILSGLSPERMVITSMILLCPLCLVRYAGRRDTRPLIVLMRVDVDFGLEVE
jgi:hypothetical protein